MSRQNPETTEFIYYPDGDRDEISRRTRISLALEGGNWRIMGQSKPLPPDALKAIVESVRSGRGEIQKVVSGRRRVNGKADLERFSREGPSRKAA